ncbi:unnamed protein product [Trichogramma brassicae]|uniref:Ribosomal protein L15 n=1 Tax=Trichogramma brassicae TaxID=86971 RepID=A0A6H5J7A8_9HYME|nr:unnamed protein product [Trichogramma brassicae]
MGAYKYIAEISRKKQSEVMRFLLRVRCWQYRQLTRLHRAPRPTRPEKARRLGLQGKTRFLHLQNSCSPWWTQTPSPQRCHLWQTQGSGYQPIETHS